MNYAVYFEDSGLIYKITSTLPGSSESFLVISPEQTEKFYSGQESMSDYMILQQKSGPGALIKKQDYFQKLSVQESRVYSVPRDFETAEFKIIQDSKLKICTIKINCDHKPTNNILLAACKPGDPHWLYWTWGIKASEIEDKDYIINYKGKDDFEFFTKKIFKSYSHEQI